MSTRRSSKEIVTLLLMRGMGTTRGPLHLAAQSTSALSLSELLQYTV